MIGAITRSVCTSAYQSVDSASGSPRQKRRRERRMYQLERSSTYDSYARITSTVLYDSYPASASRTKARVRSTSQRSSGFNSPRGSSRANDRPNRSMFADDNTQHTEIE